MLHRSFVHLHKLLSKHPFGIFPKRKSPFPLRTLESFSNQCSSYCNSTKPQRFGSPTSVNSANRFMIWQDIRKYSVETDKEVDKINLKFAEAREEIESALESKETVYFDEEAECARSAVNEVLEMYNGLLGKLPESERAAIQRSMGLKIEQLKAELEQLND
ncbi:hypothetical protein CDL12_23054 [Handroanthus impetiginosus]|uniref:Uncharacterized protein n=1 Tax=Handroanthus impetiginosus TaxID=429701 RepID=A0A2G9GGJ6_9LAMI|nr:hypothetical protein CDL12_23054 [Handroanthus impetiginosus]